MCSIGETVAVAPAEGTEDWQQSRVLEEVTIATGFRMRAWAIVDLIDANHALASATVVDTAIAKAAAPAGRSRWRGLAALGSWHT